MQRQKKISPKNEALQAWITKHNGTARPVISLTSLRVNFRQGHRPTTHDRTPPTSPPGSALCEKNAGFCAIKHQQDEASKQPFQYKLQQAHGHSAVDELNDLLESQLCNRKGTRAQNHHPERQPHPSHR